MKRKAYLVSMCLLVGIILGACGPSQAELDAQATKTTADILATQSEPPPAETETIKVEQSLKTRSTSPETVSEAVETEESTPDESEPSPVSAAFDKYTLWVDGPHLRGANIWQAIVIPELDGLEFKGDGRVGPPYSQEDFNRLAAMGANYVSISGPGLFTETSPYTVDPGVQANLDNLLAMIAEADMFATIGFRTGPGRSEFTLCCGGDPYFEDYFNDSVWEEQAAQDAWVEMWRYTAKRYGDNPIVAGYKLMVEPNAAGVLLDMYDADEFYADYAGTLYDWNRFYPRLVAGIREVDAGTPILVGGMSWSRVDWLPYLQPIDDPRTVYVVHQYEPQDEYTHQDPDGENTYPGMWDTDYDDEDDQFDRAWLEDLLSTVDEFAATHGVPVAVDEYGVNRWVPDAAEFMDDQMDLFEQRGMNQALWEWQTSWKPFADDVNDMDYRLGPDPNNLSQVPNDLMNVITQYWGRNTIRPSNLTEQAATTGQPVEPAGGDWWQPAVNTTWQWQLEQAVDYSFDVDMYDIEMFDNDANVVDMLHAQGRKVVCYISAGSWEEWRPDQDQFPASVIGNDYGGWPGEKWLDIRQLDLLAPIMRARLDECQAKGFDGIEPDNIDGYTNDTGFPLTYEDQLTYNIWLANEAHTRGLSIGLKNDPDQVADLLPYFDWALTEDCFAEDWCEEMLPFIAAGKPVFAAEYTDTGITTDQFCPQAKTLNISAILKNRDLGAYREACRYGEDEPDTPLSTPTVAGPDATPPPEAAPPADDSLLRDFTLPSPLFAPDSAWNQTAVDAAVWPDSDRQILVTYRVLRGDVTALVGYDEPATTWPFMDISLDEFSVPVFRASAGQQNVLLCNYEGNREWPHPKFGIDREGGPMPVPAPAGTVRPAGPEDTDADGHLVLYNPETFEEYDLWQATTVRDAECESQGGGLPGSTILEAGVIDFFDARGPGANPDTYYSARAHGTPLLAGLILPEDVESGVIAHALALAIPGPRNTGADPSEPLSSDYFYPASTTETDFYSTNPYALAAGQRIRLKQTLVDDEGNLIDESRFAPITRIFLTALRTYGAYLVDNAGGFSFSAEDIHTAVLHLSDNEVNALIGQPPGTPLPADMTGWQIVMDKLTAELELIPIAYGPWEEGQDPATATIEVSNFEVVEPATVP